MVECENEKALKKIQKKLREQNWYKNNYIYMSFTLEIISLS